MKVIIINGGGKFLCVGADINAKKGLTDLAIKYLRKFSVYGQIKQMGFLANLRKGKGY